MNDIFLYIMLAIISFFPIVIWAYSFVFIDDNPINKKRFFLGILGGALAVFPILNMDKILDILDFKYLNVFYFAAQIQNFFTTLEFGISLSIFLVLLILFSFLLGGFYKNKRQILNIYLKSFFVFLFFIFVSVIFIFLLNFVFQNFNFNIENPVAFGNIIFDTLKLIIFYYFIVAFIEESAKHFNFLQSDVLKIKSIKDGVLYSIFIALGFSFVENILYLYNYYQVYGLSGELLKLYFYRSTFSVVVHVLSSSIVAYYFSKALLLYKEKNLSFPYLKIFLYGLTVSVLLHLFFDVFLTLGFTFVIFLYFVGGYLYVSSIFYKE